MLRKRSRCVANTTILAHLKWSFEMESRSNRDKTKLYQNTRSNKNWPRLTGTASDFAISRKEIEFSLIPRNQKLFVRRIKICHSSNCVLEEVGGELGDFKLKTRLFNQVRKPRSLADQYIFFKKSNSKWSPLTGNNIYPGQPNSRFSVYFSFFQRYKLN